MRMKHDDGDFSDPASRAPWAAGNAPPAKPASGVARGGAANGTVRSTGQARLAGTLIVMAVAGAFTLAAFGDWNTAPEVPIESGLAAVSFGRIVMLAIDAWLLILLVASLDERRPREWTSTRSRATVLLLLAGLIGVSAAL